MKASLILSILLSSCIFTNITLAQKANLHSLNIKNNKQLHEFFKFKNDGSIIISGHRGGREQNFPENSIEGFQNVLEKMPAFFEIDPRLTKDSIIVLLHDETMERTTTGKGKLSDYTWKELQSIRLKDSEGRITNCKIPTLEEAILWSKGKTVINLDKKDVPLYKIVALIKKHKAQNHVMLTVHTGAQARYYYDRFPHIMLSAFCRNDKEYEDLALSGVPWENMIAYVGTSITKDNKAIVQKLHEKGVCCMISTAPTHDRLETLENRASNYKKEILAQPDIIESDIPTEIWNVLQAK